MPAARLLTTWTLVAPEQPEAFYRASEVAAAAIRAALGISQRDAG